MLYTYTHCAEGSILRWSRPQVQMAPMGGEVTTSVFMLSSLYGSHRNLQFVHTVKPTNTLNLSD